MCFSSCTITFRVRSGEGGDPDVPYAELDGATKEIYPKTNQRGLGPATYEAIWGRRRGHYIGVPHVFP